MSGFRKWCFCLILVLAFGMEVMAADKIVSPSVGTVGTFTPSADGESLTCGTEFRVIVNEGLKITGHTKDCVIVPGEDLELKVSLQGVAPIQYLWEVSTDGGQTFTAVGTDPIYLVESAQGALLEDKEYIYRITVTDATGQSKSELVRILVSRAFAPGTVKSGPVSAETYLAVKGKPYLWVTAVKSAEHEELLKECLSEGYRPWIICDISVRNHDGSVLRTYYGSVDLTFDVGAEYEGQTLRVFHLYQGVIEEYASTVVDGKLIVTVDSLSPFMVEVPENSTGVGVIPDKEPTGGSGSSSEEDTDSDEDAAGGSDVWAGGGLFVPRTGDSQPVEWMLLLCVAAAAGLVLVNRLKKKE